jgi:hypothetical protein
MVEGELPFGVGCHPKTGAAQDFPAFFFSCYLEAADISLYPTLHCQPLHQFASNCLRALTITIF